MGREIGSTLTVRQDLDEADSREILQVPAQESEVLLMGLSSQASTEATYPSQALLHGSCTGKSPWLQDSLAQLCLFSGGDLLRVRHLRGRKEELIG